MTRPSLKSRFGEQIRAFVGYKNSLGFPYNESIRILGRFDDFCVERFPEKDCLDCELALAWLEKRDTENTAGHRNRIMVIREFAKYLNALFHKLWLFDHNIVKECMDCAKPLVTCGRRRFSDVPKPQNKVLNTFSI